MKKTLLTFAIACLALAAGCGYTTRSSISGKYQTIYVQPFANKIDIASEAGTQTKFKVYRPKLETDITRAVSNKYLFDGNLKPVSEETAAVTLKGELVDFSRDPLRYDDNDNVQEYRVNVRVTISLWDNREQKMIWEEPNFTGSATYFTAGHVGSKSDETAINEAISDLARRIVERTVEDW